MTRRIWASLDDYLPPTAPNMQGRNFANAYFFSALLKYGSFDAYYLFLSNSAHVRLFLEKYAPLFEKWGVLEKVVVRDRLSLKELLLSDEKVLFHQSDHIAHFNALCRLRNRLGATVPISAFIHSISYPHYMRSYLEMMLTGATSHDALVCSSIAGRTVLERCFDRIAQGLGSLAPQIQLPVIPLGIDESNANRPDRNSARAAFGWENEVVALVFGRFSDVDKMDLFPLLQAFRIVIKTGDPYRLCLAGSVHSKPYLEMIKLWIRALNLEAHVQIVETPDETTKQQLFFGADLFVSLADNPQETFGLTILEAMHAGLPLLVSDFNGYRELVTDDVGVRVPTYWSSIPVLDELEPVMDERTFHLYTSQSICVDVDALTMKLERLFRDTDYRKRLSDGAIRRFESTYRHQQIIHRLEMLWDRLTEQRWEAKPADDWISLKTFETFEHYVTRRLTSDDLLEISGFGRQILAHQAGYPLLPNMDVLVEPTAAIAMLELLDKPMTMKKALDQAAQWSQHPQYLLHWMVKHGLLSRRVLGEDQYSS